MRRDELKPCPFCGSLNVDHAALAIDAPPHPECLDCGASARDLRAWNRRAALEAEQPVATEWHRADRPGTGSVLLYTLREGGWRRGEPVMVNDVMINVDRANGSETDIEPIVRRVHASLSRPERAVDIPADLVERCSEIFGWKATGILTGGKLRGQARAIRENFNSVFDAGEALRQAEEETKREAMRFIIAISATRIADSAEAGGSATLSSDADEACPGEHQEVLDAIQSHNSGEDE